MFNVKDKVADNGGTWGKYVKIVHKDINEMHLVTFHHNGCSVYLVVHTFLGSENTCKYCLCYYLCCPCLTILLRLSLIESGDRGAHENL